MNRSVSILYSSCLILLISICFRFESDPSQDTFRQVMPEPQAPVCTMNGRVVPQPKGVPFNIHGWRSFDVRTSYYDNSVQPGKHLSYVIHWFLPYSPRWQKFNTPAAGTALSLMGRLLGRLNEKHPSEPSSLLAFQVLSIDFIPERSSNLGSSPSSSSSSVSIRDRPASSWA